MIGDPKDKNIPDSKIHEGHRARMRSKLLCHGQRIFDTYELLEMLLYYTVPYKDTNPISKRLLYTFGDLEGVLSASYDELVKVNGVGEKSAGLIKLVGRLSEVIGSEPDYADGTFGDYGKVGRFLISYFKKSDEKKVIALYFDNAMNLIALEEVYRGIDYDSGAVTARPFLDTALRIGAVAVITAHNHPYSSAYPTSGDRATNQMLVREFAKARVTLAEHYVVSGDRYMSIVLDSLKSFSQYVDLDSFIKSRGLEISDSGELFYSDNNCYNTEDAGYFAELVGYALKKDAELISSKVLMRYRTIENSLDADADSLSRIAGESCAMFIKLLGYLSSRRKTDSFAMKCVHTPAEIAEYFKALFIGLSVENVYVMCIDSSGRVVSVERVSEGIVNSAEILPRRIVEIALKYSCAKVVLAHNHPFGRPEPSDDDLGMTRDIYELLRAVGIELSHHIIVAGQRFEVIGYSESGEKY